MTNPRRMQMAAAGQAGGGGYELWAWGRNNAATLGTGNTTGYSSPVQVGTKEWAQQANAGYGGDRLAFGIKTGGTLWAWGTGGNGHLGLGNTTTYSSPVQVGSLTDWEGTLIGQNQGGRCVKDDGTLWAWGSNIDGQLGDGSTSNRNSPVQIGSLTTWATPGGAMYRGSACIKTDGTLWTWGNADFGMLGLSNTTNYSSPVQVGSLTNWSKISKTGQAHMMAIKTDGTLWSWGRNYHGQCGHGDQVDRSSPTQVGGLTTWAQIAATTHASAAIKTDGTLWSWGRNHRGQLGHGGTTIRSSPVQVGSLTDWAKIAGGNGEGFHMIKTDGTKWAMGQGMFGRLGDGTTTSKSSPVQIGSDTTWAELSNTGGSYWGHALKS
jgi:alpha-tubulin suppressor-like RCC1 family protein